MLLEKEQEKILELSKDFKQKLIETADGYNITSLNFSSGIDLGTEKTLFPQGAVRAKTQSGESNPLLELLLNKRDKCRLSINVSNLQVPDKSHQFYFSLSIHCSRKEDGDISLSFDRPYTLQRIGKSHQRVTEIPLYFLGWWEESLKQQISHAVYMTFGELSDPTSESFLALQKAAETDVVYNASKAVSCLKRNK